MGVRVLTGLLQGGSQVQKTDRDMTLYVATGGDDANDGLSSGTPLATIQAAVDKVPDLILHHVIINVAAGTYNQGAQIVGKRVATGQYLSGREASFLLQGEMGPPTLATGTTSGTSDSGDERTLGDSGQSWTVDELKGMYAVIDGAQHVIESNTGSELTIVGKHLSTMSGKAYSISEPQTVIEHSGAGSAFYVHGCNGHGSYYFAIKQFSIEDSAAYQGGIQVVSSECYVDRIRIRLPVGSGCLYGIYSSFSYLRVGESSVLENFGGGMFASFGGVHGKAFLVDDLDGDFGWSGVELCDLDYFTLEYLAIHDQGDADDQNGLIVQRCNKVIPIEVDITGSDGNGILVLDGSKIGSDKGLVLSGTGNGGFGVKVDGGVVDFKGVPTMTGTSGDLSLDAGCSALTWAAAFAADGDVETAADFLSWARRRD